MDKYKILIAENETIMGDLISKLFTKSFNCEITPVTNGESAIDKLVSDNFHLAILSAQLPDITAIKIMEEIKELQYLPPTIVISSKDNYLSRYEHIKAGANDFIPKPFSVHNFLNAVTKLLEKLPEEIITH